MSEEQRRAAVASRGGYKSKATRVKRVAEKYSSDASLLTLPSAVTEIEHNLNLIPELRHNLEKIQETITGFIEDDEERNRDLEEFKATLDNLDASEGQLLELRKSALDVAKDTDATKSAMDFFAKKLEEQQMQAEIERRVAEARYKADREAEQKKFETSLHLLITENQSFRSSSPIRPDAPNGQVRLREVDVPDFDGNLRQWLSFKALFTGGVIKNRSLTDENRLFYLHSYLKGEAKDVIEHLPISNENFKVAWDLLVSKYDDQDAIAKSHIRNFLSVSKINKPTKKDLEKFHEVLASSVRALDALDRKERDIWLIYLALERLDADTKLQWARTSKGRRSTFVQFLSFIRDRYKELGEAEFDMEPTQQKKADTKSKQHSKGQKWSSNVAQGAPVASETSQLTPIPCACCGKNNHRTVKCYKFRGMSASKRLEVVQRAQLCYNCLESGHVAGSCKSSACRHCSEKHSTWIHEAIHPVRAQASTNVAAAVESVAVSENGQSSGTSAALNCTVPSNVPHVILGTAIVHVLNSEGERVPCRALLDSGSQPNFISEKMCQLLRLPKMKSTCKIEGIGSVQAPASHQVSITFGPRGFDKWMQAQCIVQSKITGIHPAVKVNTRALPIPAKLPLADPQWFMPQQIDMLIGGQHFWSVILDRTMKLGPGLPVLKDSIFGWLVAGEITSHSSNLAITQSCNLSTMENEGLEAILKRFLDMEEVAGPAQQKKDNDLQVESHYQETVSRDPTGRFIVHLPLTEKVEQLASNKSNALRQLFFLEKRLNNNPGMREKYDEVFAEYLSLGIIEKVPHNEIQNKCYYLPHHGIYKESSTTTKLRIVFNASSKTKTSFSLNDVLLTGPVIQDTLVEILWKFRQHQWAMTCDITKMYLQFLLTCAHKDYHRFLWRNPQTGEIEVLRFCTLCFGVKPSPFLAIRSMKQLAIEDGDKFPAAKEVVNKSFYVDDCLVSAETVQELYQIKTQLIELLRCGKLELSKWISNVPNFDGEMEVKDVTANVDSSEPVKTLGLYWDPRTDHFCFKLCQITTAKHPTKREVLSTIARIFDPLGLLCPIVINAKCIMQMLWKLECGWDDSLPDAAITEWQNFTNSLTTIPTIEIPRWISEIPKVVRRELHIFCDASKKAYGTAIYVVTEDDAANRSSRLLTAKSRVAPIKPATIPKLELCAAELGVKLLTAAINSANYDSIYCWTDASIVLWQIRTPTNREVFVKNRLKVILEHTSAENWSHVPSAQNPADIVSRGATADQLIESDLWWNGPEWLRMSSKHWPENITMETSQICLLITNAQWTGWTGIREYLLTMSNSYLFILRVIAQTLRFSNKCKRSEVARDGPLFPEELDRAFIILVRLEQQEVLNEDYKILSGISKKQLSPRLRNLGAYLDENGLMRMDDRMDNAAIAKRNPIILPGGPLSKRLLRHVHNRWWHAGPTLMMAEIHRKFMPLFGQRSARYVYNTCVECFRRKPRLCQQIMGQLPAARVTLTLPFDKTGVDFAGPFKAKSSHLRKAPIIKAYIAVFVCMAVKAVHLEVVEDLTTESFLDAFARFSVRRKKPKHVYSDNGTNFKGAANVFKEFFSDSANQEVIINKTSEETTWHFNPPRSPHWGGLWEAAVKSMKYHFHRVIGDTILTVSELATVVTKIEGVLNSRPLTALPTAPGDPDFLTPEKLLKPVNEGSVAAIPEWDLRKVPRLNRWQITQKLYQEVSQQWKRDYLRTMQRRTKWTKEMPNLKVGDLVLMIDGVQPGAKWPLARVISVHPGEDKRVRKVMVQSAKGTYTRTVQNLAKLPLEDDEDPESFSTQGEVNSPGSVSCNT